MQDPLLSFSIDSCESRSTGSCSPDVNDYTVPMQIADIHQRQHQTNLLVETEKVVEEDGDWT